MLLHRGKDKITLSHHPAKYQSDILPYLNVIRQHNIVRPDRMKQKEAGLRKKGTPLLRDMMIQREPITIMVRLKRAKIAAARFRSDGQQKEIKNEKK